MTTSFPPKGNPAVWPPVWIDRHGWPVEFFRGRPVLNFLRWCLWASIWKTWRHRGRWRRIGNGGIVDSWRPQGDDRNSTVGCGGIRQ